MKGTCYWNHIHLDCSSFTLCSHISPDTCQRGEAILKKRRCMLDVSLSMMSREIGKSLLQHRDMMSKGMCACECARAVFYPEARLCAVPCPFRGSSCTIG